MADGASASGASKKASKDKMMGSHHAVKSLGKAWKEDWCPCSRYSNTIIGDTFVALKTPLDR